MWVDVVGVDSGLNWLRYWFWKALFVVTEPGSDGELVNEGDRSICAAIVRDSIIRTWEQQKKIIHPFPPNHVSWAESAADPTVQERRSLCWNQQNIVSVALFPDSFLPLLHDLRKRLQIIAKWPTIVIALLWGLALLRVAGEPCRQQEWTLPVPGISFVLNRPL